MARRAPQTLADYMVVGISPALVMFMVGSLLWFLTIVFYQGDYGWRLLLVHAMFIMGCVSVTRLSMEEGAAYASLFAFPLALVVAVAYVSFVKVQGSLAAISPLINLMLEGVIWFSAHKLTWDCTLIDDSQDSSKQGLLQAMGWDRALGEIEPPPAHTSREPIDAADAEAVSDRGDADAGLSGEAKVFEWIKSLFKPDKRPHTPGVWIVYFSLAALPLFGLGQWFIPADQVELRRQAFWLLVVYVACGLGLLMNTSFLGLRRYLRQRNLLMPPEMAATWLGAGVTIIVAVLLVVWLLPRPSSEYSISQLDVFKSKPLDPSRWGWGKDGAKRKGTKQTSASGEGGQKSENAQSSEKGDSQTDATGQGKGKKGGGQGDGKKSSGDAKSDGGKSSGGKGTGQDKSSDGAKTKESGSDAPKGSKSEDQSGSKNGDKQRQSDQDDASSGSQSDSKSQTSTEKSSNQDNDQRDRSSQDSSQEDSSGQSKEEGTQQESNEESADDGSSSSNSASSPSTSPSRISQWLSRISPTFGQILQWILYLLTIATLIVLAVLYRAQLLAALKRLIAELKALWARWFGGPQPVAAAVDAAQATPPRPFYTYADPFASGMAAQASLAELVRYTFEALEAWGREHDAPRGAGQTAHEYARVLAEVHQPLAGNVRFLAEVYGQIAYAQSSVRQVSLEPLKSLWRQMRLGVA